MKRAIPLQLSRSLLDATGMSATLHHLERLPTKNKLLIVSNHRSPLDAPLLMTAIGRPVRFAGHYYMSQVPLRQQASALMGAFPLVADQRRQSSFFRQSARFLQANQVVGVFPEGAGRWSSDPADCHCFKGGKTGKACSACLVSAL